jgi:hypothetical protein
MNNRLNERINKELPHDFSICDLDGIVYCFYKIKDNTDYQKRLIIYEAKNKDEAISKTQLNTMKMLWHAIKWETFDRLSGMFIFRAVDDDFNELEISTLFDQDKKTRVHFEDLHKWFSAKNEKEQKQVGLDSWM